MQKDKSQSTPAIKIPLTPTSIGSTEHPRSRKSSYILSKSLKSLQKSQSEQLDSSSSSPTRTSPSLGRLQRKAGSSGLPTSVVVSTLNANGASSTEIQAIQSEEKIATTNKESVPNEHHDDEKGQEKSHDGDEDNGIVSPRRSNSPPVPALMKGWGI